MSNGIATSSQGVSLIRKWDETAPVGGFRPDDIAVAIDLEHATPRMTIDLGENRLILLSVRDSLWIRLVRPDGSGFVLRGALSPSGCIEAASDDMERSLPGEKDRRKNRSGNGSSRSSNKETTIDVGRLTEGEDGKTLEFTILGTTMGRFRCRLTIQDSEAPLFRWQVWLTPMADLIMPPSPWNLYPLDKNGSPLSTEGVVHAAQRGSCAGILYFTITKPDAGTVLYFQNLTSLNDYCEITETDVHGCVSSSWPGLGYLPPASKEKPLPRGREISLCDCFVTMSTVQASNDRDNARLFLDLLARIYRRLPKPETQYRDWIGMAEATARDLTHSAKCHHEENGYLFLRPYTGAEVPDSMTQLTVLLPLIEYANWAGREIAVIDRFRESVREFYDPRLKTMRRYLGSVGPDKNALEVDSWYLYHPLANLARLAEIGDDEAKDLFFHSIDFGIKAAHHFEYWWPVQFNIETFDVITGDRKQGESGQTDVPGLYAYVMMRAWDLSGDRRYLDEAAAALRSQEGLSFAIGYQFNNTAWGAAACLRLWRETGDRFYYDQCFVYLASFFHNTVLWEANFGPAKCYSTFLGVTCLHDGEYMAAYEEYEAFTAFHEILSIAGDDLPDGARLLLADYCRYALHRSWCYYPSELPRDLLSEEVRNGHIDRSLAIPMEDIYADWSRPGAVGQEIYGAGMALSFVTRSYRRFPGASFLLYCDARVEEMKRGKERIELRVQGDPETAVRLRLIPDGSQRLPQIDVRSESGGMQEGIDTPDGHREFALRGDDRLVLEWSAKTKRKGASRDAG